MSYKLSARDNSKNFGEYYDSCREAQSKTMSESMTAQSVTAASTTASAAKKSEDDRRYESFQNQPSTDLHQSARVHPSNTADDENRVYTPLQNASSTVSCQNELVGLPSAGHKADIKQPMPTFYEELPFAT